MIEPQILYGVTCDRCGETLINSNDNSAWYDRSTAEEEASEEDWHSVAVIIIARTAIGRMTTVIELLKHHFPTMCRKSTDS